MASKGFPRLTDRRTPKEKSLPLTCGHYATHKHPKVKGLVGETPTIPLHFTPTSVSSPNHSRQLYGGVPHSAADLKAATTFHPFLSHDD